VHQYRLEPTWRGLLYLFVCLLYLARLVGIPSLFWPSFVVIAAAIGVSLWHVRGVGLLIVAGLAVAAFTSAFGTGATFAEIAKGLVSTHSVMAFLGFVQLMGKPIQIGGYGKATVSLLLRWVSNARSLPAVGGTVAYFLTGVESMGSLPTAYYALEKGAAPGGERRSLIKGLMWGQALGLAWAPTTGLFGIILSVFALNVPVYVLLALPITFVALVVGLSINWKETNLPTGDLSEFQVDPLTVRRAIAFLIIQAGVIAVILVGQAYVPLSSLDWVLLVILIVALLWGFWIDAKAMFRSLRRYPLELGTLDVNFAVFPLAGLAGAMLHRTAVGEAVVLLTGWVSSPMLQLCLLTLLSFVLSVTGIYPAVTILIMGPMIQVAPGLPLEFLVLGMSIGGCIGLPMTPASGVLQLAKALSGEPLDRLGLRFIGRMGVPSLAASLGTMLLVYGVMSLIQ
jgi:hypothetical protein